MKTIGLIGGMSWESTLEYYRLINQGVKEKLGGFHSAKIIMYSLDFSEIEVMQRLGDWQGTAMLLTDATRSIQRAGADFFLVCTNTMHKVVPQIEREVSIPCLHIGDATGEALTINGIKKVGLLGTTFTMEHNFYKGRLQNNFGLDVVIPDKSDRITVHSIIFNELCLGIIKKESKEKFIKIIHLLVKNGAQAIILGCTEIGLLIAQDDVNVPVYDTTVIHAMKAVECAVT